MSETNLYNDILSYLETLNADDLVDLYNRTNSKKFYIYMMCDFDKVIYDMKITPSQLLSYNLEDFYPEDYFFFFAGNDKIESFQSTLMDDGYLPFSTEFLAHYIAENRDSLNNSYIEQLIAERN